MLARQRAANRDFPSAKGGCRYRGDFRQFPGREGWVEDYPWTASFRPISWRRQRGINGVIADNRKTRQPAKSSVRRREPGVCTAMQGRGAAIQKTGAGKEPLILPKGGVKFDWLTRSQIQPLQTRVVRCIPISAVHQIARTFYTRLYHFERHRFALTQRALALRDPFIFCMK